MTYEELYEKMCWSCNKAVKCHEDCVECDAFLEAFESEEENGD